MNRKVTVVGGAGNVGATVARSIADHLLRAHQDGRFERLVLAAAPEFLGTLRKLLDPSVASAIGLEINKDYTQVPPDKLTDQIEAHAAKA